MRNSSVFSFLCGALLIGLAPTLAHGYAEPIQSLDGAIDVLSTRIAEYAGKNGVASLAVRNFDGPRRSAAGSTIRRQLEQKLTAKGVKLGQAIDSSHELRGEFRVAADDSDKKLVVQLITRLFLPTGEEQLGFRESTKVSSAEDVALLTGTNVDLSSASAIAAATPSVSDAPITGNPGTITSVPPATTNPATPPNTTNPNPNPPTTTTPPVPPTSTGAPPPATTTNPPTAPGGNPKPLATGTLPTGVGSNIKVLNDTRNNLLRQSIEKPSAAVRQGSVPNTPTAISARSDSAFRIEVLFDGPDGRQFAATPVVTGGFPLVSLKRGAVFQVRFFNDADHDVGVKLSLDGHNSFVFSENEGYRAQGMWYIPARSQGTIRGWHKNNSQIYPFIVTDESDSVSVQGKLGVRAGDIGSITALVFPAWTGKEPPAIELAGRSKNAIGAAPPVSQSTQEVPVNFGQTLVASLTVRYERPDIPGDVKPGVPGDLPPDRK